MKPINEFLASRQESKIVEVKNSCKSPEEAYEDYIANLADNF